MATMLLMSQKRFERLEKQEILACPGHSPSLSPFNFYHLATRKTHNKTGNSM